MTVEYTDGKLQFALKDFFTLLADDQQVAMIDLLSCRDAVIKNVTDQILDGWTERSSHGGILCTASPAPTFGLDYAMRQVALRAGEVANKEIARLQDALKDANDELRKYAEGEFGRRSRVQF